jgi:hypothetical protein
VSLTTAILFHQIFEGLSLGIRIASLPHKEVEECHIADEDEENLQRLASSLQPACYVPSPIIPNLDSDPGAPSNSTLLPPQHGRHTDDNTDSRTIGRGKEVQSPREREVHWLQPTLSILFAVTTPFGMCAGMTLWKDGSDSSLFFYIIFAYMLNLIYTF